MHCNALFPLGLSSILWLLLSFYLGAIHIFTLYLFHSRKKLSFKLTNSTKSLQSVAFLSICTLWPKTLNCECKCMNVNAEPKLLEFSECSEFFVSVIFVKCVKQTYGIVNRQLKPISAHHGGSCIHKTEFHAKRNGPTT